jgi:hypothetical protein
MATRILFEDGFEITVPESEHDVVLAVRRDHPNPVRLKRDESGGTVHVNWDHIQLIEASRETP